MRLTRDDRQRLRRHLIAVNGHVTREQYRAILEWAEDILSNKYVLDMVLHGAADFVIHAEKHEFHIIPTEMH